MKIFLTSFPFDEENSGDYDYCTVTVRAINDLKPKTGSAVAAEYLTASLIPEYNAAQAKKLLSNIRAKNSGGEEFYSSLRTFYNDPERISLAANVIKYVTNRSKLDSGQKIFNLQLRSPETGFLFSPEDLDTIKVQGFKVVVTCHEYELNYSRKWLQTVCHPYFFRADRVLFFSQQDMLSATIHASRQVFLDEMFKSDELPDLSSMLLGFSSKAHSHMRKTKAASENDEAILVTKQELTSLDCTALVGSISFPKAGLVRCKFSGQTITLHDSAQLELGYGIRTQIYTPPQPRPFLVSGVIVNPGKTDELDRIKDKTKSEFNFDNPIYDLVSRSALTRVAPTTADMKILSLDDAIHKPANIVIFGLIREGKGFEDAVSIIQKIHNEYKEQLPNARLIIVGKVSSPFELLATLFNIKFGFKDVIAAKDIQQLSDSSDDTAQREEISKIVELAREYKLKDIKASLMRLGTYCEDIEYYILNRTMSKHHSQVKIKLSKLSVLQLLIQELSEVIPERLPIDFVLDVSKDDLLSVFSQAKYAIKYDEKGWANNASGLINLLAYGCVLYTGYGMCTEDEVITGRYKGALVLPKGRYCLLEGEKLSPEEEVEYKRQHFKKEAERKLPIEAAAKIRHVNEKDVIADIIVREQRDKGVFEGEYVSEVLDSKGDNQETFRAAHALLHEQFDPAKIAGEMIACFESLFD